VAVTAQVTPVGRCRALVAASAGQFSDYAGYADHFVGQIASGRVWIVVAILDVR